MQLAAFTFQSKYNQQKRRRKSAEQKPGLSFAVRQAKNMIYGIYMRLQGVSYLAFEIILCVLFYYIFNMIKQLYNNKLVETYFLF